MFTVYGVYRSRASRPIWLLNEIGIPFTHVPVMQAYRMGNPGSPYAPMNTTSPEFLAVNPQGQVPAYVEGDLVLTESLAITLHIARQHGGEFGPRDAAETALMEQWALFAASNIEGPALEILMATNGDAPGKQGTIAAAADKLRRYLTRLNDHLSAQTWMVGNRFTVADLNLAECARYAQAHPTLIGEFPAVQAWLASCQSRPAFQKMWAARMAEPE